jgi:prepilin-type N-terminal cleavage/methylation domain-containing protein
MRRRGFTIVELLVAMALIVFIMAILSEAFVTGLQTFRELKAVGDMNEKLRSASNLLRRYLAADHFEGRKRLSDPNFWAEGPPREGFFRLWQGGPSFSETTLDGVPSYRSPDATLAGLGNHILHFTVKLRGNERGDFFQANVPTGSPLLGLGAPDGRYQDVSGTQTATYCFPWAEVAFFLRPAGIDTANGTPLYTLYYRQRLCVQDSSLVTTPLSAASQKWNYLEMSQTADANGNLRFNSPADLTAPIRRFGMATNNLSGRPFTSIPNFTLSYPSIADDNIGNPSTPVVQPGADVLLTDVLSFNVRLLVDPRRVNLNSGVVTTLAGLQETIDLSDLQGAVIPAAGFRFPIRNPNFTAASGVVFDTWSSLKDDSPIPGFPAGIDYSGWATAGGAGSIPIYQDGSNPANKIRVLGVQVTIRVWDSRTEQTRQVTIIQDL